LRQDTRPTTAHPNPTQTAQTTATAPAHLDDQRRVERVLEPLGELEGHEVAEVERLGGGAAPRVEVEALAALEGVEELGEVAAFWGLGGWMVGLERSVYN
jgi:hypothetical protein